MDLTPLAPRAGQPLQPANLTSAATGRRRLIGVSNSNLVYFMNFSVSTAKDACNLIDAGAQQILVKMPATLHVAGGEGLVTLIIHETKGCREENPVEMTSMFRTNFNTDFYVFCSMNESVCEAYYDKETLIPALKGLYRRSMLTVEDLSDRCLVDGAPQENGAACCKECREEYVLEGCECHDPEDGQLHCFPADATVRVLGRTNAVRMDELQYGDLVRSVDRSTGSVSYKPVYLFGHRESAGSRRYVHIATAAGRTLAATSGHFVPVCVEGCTAEQLTLGAAVMQNRRAGNIRVGDVVLTADPSPAFETVESVELLAAKGAFNPYVRGADLIVDGVVASPHSDWILDSVAPAWMVPYLPYIYEALLAPVYGLYCIVGPATAEWLAHGLRLAESGASPAGGHAGYWAVLAGMAAPLSLTALLLGRTTAAALKKRV
ncbi:hypothetical protein GPECTOR_10g1053 [Gonium pectorale]|uniref:Hint domain-containing protein n=1 Tax=Gonium pectorale TaxID=33097 RepID=A0A150GRT3_GONPE|nr:hypothetical protein GPECTOR_10g1053 [Gonium pectorale]|eukprot:KXZ52030.1 hypothetical protein GPECTOR_10g1053 [Gonium pectorale]